MNTTNTMQNNQSTMNTVANKVEGNWEQFKGNMKQAWGKLGDDDYALIQEGKRQEFLGRVQAKHCVKSEEAERQLSGFEKECGYGADSNEAGNNAQMRKSV